MFTAFQRQARLWQGGSTVSFRVYLSWHQLFIKMLLKIFLKNVKLNVRVKYLKVFERYSIEAVVRSCSSK